jgi:hypothetical protein
VHERQERVDRERERATTCAPNGFARILFFLSIGTEFSCSPPE